MISVEEAQAIVLALVKPLGWEYAELLDALGRVLAEEVTASEPMPPWDNAAMDGYALRAQDSRGATREHPVPLRIIGTIAAGQIFPRPLEAGQALRIMTGTPLPRGADAVIRLEDTKARGQEVSLLREVRSGQNVRYAGEDLKPGEKVFEVGTLCRPGVIGLLAALGRRRVAVYRRPRVGIVATGDELLGWGDAPTPGKIHNSNSFALAAQVLQAGGVPILLGPVADDQEHLAARIQEGLEADLLVTSGGVSVGDYDLITAVLEELGAEIRVHKVNMRPGKPFTFALLHGKAIFGLPGNPVSCMVTFELFLRPALRKMQGHRSLFHPEVVGIAAEPISNTDRRPAYLRVVLTPTDQGYRVRLTGDQGSGMLHSMALADGLACVPGETEIPTGSAVRILLLNEDIRPTSLDIR